MKFSGRIGICEYREVSPGRTRPVVTAKDIYKGDITRTRRWSNGERINDELSLSSVVSIVADPFLFEHVGEIAYVEVYGAKWKVTDIDANNRPRLRLTLGGLYNGPTDSEDEV